MPEKSIDSTAVLAQLERILTSQAFQGAGRSGTLLRFLVEHVLSGRSDQLKEYTLGAEALGRGASFDPRSDSIARVEASRLRGRLEVYYATDGRLDPLRIVLPKGTYVPTFEAPRQAADTSARWKLATAGAATVALVASWFAWNRPAIVQSPVTRVEVDLGAGVSMRTSQVGSSSVIISPDARRLVFVSFREQVPRLMTTLLHQVSATEAKELPGTEGARGPFFSPDGRWVAYWAAGKLWKTPAEGGTPLPLCDAPDLLGGSWGDDGTIVAALTVSGLWRVPSEGGKATRIDGVPHDAGPRWPQVLPGSRAVLFSAGAPGAGPPRVSVFSFGNGRVTDVAIGGGYGRYLPGGHLAWVDRGNLLVARFDLKRLQVRGKPAVMLNDVAVTMYGSAEFDVSRAGVLVCRRRPGGAKSVLTLVDSTGVASRLAAEPAEYSWPRFSPDGKRLSFLVGQLEQRDAIDFRIIDVYSRKVLRSSTGTIHSSPVWSPDGRFLVAPRPSGGLNWVTADGDSPPRTLLASTALQIPWSFDARGGRLAFYQRERGAGGSPTFDLWTVPVKVDGDSLVAAAPQPLLVSDAFEIYPAFSPDGRWIAYTLFQSGAYEVYVREFPDTGRQWRVSDHGGLGACWSRDGRRLFFRTSEQRIMAVDLQSNGREPRFGTPRLWVDAPLADTGVAPNFDVSPDRTIAALTPAAGTSAEQDHRHVTFLFNFLDEVQRLTSR